MGCCSSKPVVEESALCYTSPSGERVTFYLDPSKISHDPSEELAFVKKNDVKLFKGGDCCYLINSDWLRKWGEYASKAASEENSVVPGQIENQSLLNETGTCVAAGKKIKDDFRPVGSVVWEFLFKLYGGGPVVVLKVPMPKDGSTPKNNSWIKTVNFEDMCQVIIPEVVIISSPDNSSSNSKSIKKNKKRGDQDQGDDLMNPLIGAAAEDSGRSETKTHFHNVVKENEAGDDSSSISNNSKNKNKKKLSKAEIEAAEDAARAAAEALQAAARAEKERILKEKSAIRIQCLARRKAAEIVLRLLQEERARVLAHKAKCLSIVCRLLRLLLARLRLRRKRLLQPVVVFAKIEKVHGLKGSQAVKDLNMMVIAHGVYETMKIDDTNTLCAAYRRYPHPPASTIENNGSFNSSNGGSFFARRRSGNSSVTSSASKNTATSPSPSVLSALDSVSETAADTTPNNRHTPNGRSSLTSTAITITPLPTLSGVNSDNSTPGRSTNSTPTSNLAFTIEGGGGGSRSSTPGLSAGLDISASAYRTKLKSKPKEGCLTWDEQAIITNINGFDSIALTLVHKDASNSDHFLGQVIVPLPLYPDLVLPQQHHNASGSAATTSPTTTAGGTAIITLDVPLARFKHPITDSQGKALPLHNMDNLVSGQLSVELQASRPRATYGGWLLKQAGNILGLAKQMFKVRYFLITEGSVRYFDDAHSLAQPRGSLLAADIKSIQFGPDEAAGVDTIEIESTKDVWYLQFPVDEHDSVKDMWLRKLGHLLPASGLEAGLTAFDANYGRVSSSGNIRLSTSTGGISHGGKVATTATTSSMSAAAGTGGVPSPDRKLIKRRSSGMFVKFG